MFGKYVEVKNFLVPADDKEVITDCYWITRNGNPLGFYRGKGLPLAPLCNKNEEITNFLMRKMFPKKGGVEVKFFEVVYWENESYLDEEL